MSRELNNVLEYPAVVHTYDIQNLEGLLLTLVEAAFNDKTQREAMKSVLRSDLWQWYNRTNLIRVGEKVNRLGTYEVIEENKLVHNN